jgi:hypothetical protein
MLVILGNRLAKLEAAMRDHGTTTRLDASHTAPDDSRHQAVLMWLELPAQNE